MPRDAESRPSLDPSRLGRFKADISNAVRNDDLGSIESTIKDIPRGYRVGLLGFGLLKSCRARRVSIVHYLLNEAATDDDTILPLFNVTDGDGRNALMHARTLKIAELLLDRGAPVDAKDKYGNTALMIALITDQDTAIAELLIKHKSDLNSTDNQCRTILMNAVWKGHVRIVEVLVASQSVDVHAIDVRKRNALHHLASDRERSNEESSTKKQPGMALAGEAVTRAEHDEDILRMLLDAGVNPNATDEHDRTCLLWAAVTGNSKLARGLLESGKVDVKATEHTGRSPLHLAASNNNLETMKALLEHSADPNAAGPGDWTPLHIVCNTKSRSDAAVRLLLKQRDNAFRKRVKADPMRVTGGGKTALHLAAQVGNKAAVERLLNDIHVDRTARDKFGNTPLLCAATSLNYVRCKKERYMRHSDVLDINKPRRTSDAHTGGGHGNGNGDGLHTNGKPAKTDTKNAYCKHSICEKALSLDKEIEDLSAIERMLAPWNNAKSLPDEAVYAAKTFRATVVDFNQKRDKQIITNPTIWELLYDTEKIESALLEKEKKESALLKKSAGSASTYPRADSRTKNFRWVHLPANNPIWCLDLMTKHFIESGSRDADGYKELERSFNHQHRGLRLHSRYLTPMVQTVLRSRQTETTARATRSGSPETTQEDASTIFSKSASPGATRNSESSRPTSPMNLAAEQFTHSEARTASPKVHPQAHSSPLNKGIATGMEDHDELDQGYVSHIYMFMPYLHFETHTAREKMEQIAVRAEKLAAQKRKARVTYDPDLQDPAREDTMNGDEALFRAYLNQSNLSLHIRRTLDQSFYHNLDTDTRDRDQVIHRYQQHYDPHNKDSHKVLMVDQAWMFLVNSDLLISSFPGRFKLSAKPRNDDPEGLIEGIKQYINSSNCEHIRNLYELAIIITGRCTRAYHRHDPGSKDTQFLDMFEGVIGLAIEHEVNLFAKFDRASKIVWEWLSEDDLASRRGPPKAMKTLLDIGSETRLLKEIKDIQDELDMLRMIFGQQEHVLPSLQDAIMSVYEQTKPQNWDQKVPVAVPKRINKAFDEHKRSIVHPREDVDRMARQAERVYKSLMDLLDLKQKHANAIEAQYTREQAENAAKQAKSSAQQSLTVMVFTLVTVIFLPLSFLATLFTINISDYPRDDQMLLSGSFVYKYMFGVGLPLALVCVGFALYIGPMYEWWFEVSRKSPEVKENDFTAAKQAPGQLQRRPRIDNSALVHHSSMYNDGQGEILSRYPPPMPPMAAPAQTDRRHQTHRSLLDRRIVPHSQARISEHVQHPGVSGVPPILMEARADLSLEPQILRRRSFERRPLASRATCSSMYDEDADGSFEGV